METWGPSLPHGTQHPANFAQPLCLLAPFTLRLPMPELPTPLQIRVESFQGSALDFSILGGKWKLIYTTATDVLPILEAEYQLSPGPFSALGFPRPLEVGAGVHLTFHSCSKVAVARHPG